LKEFTDLTKLPQLLLSPFDEVDKIIEHFCKHAGTLGIVWEKREQIKEISKKDFWLLTFALKGCAGKQGKGKPSEWLSEGVKNHLRDIENCGDKHESQYPKILLALSPLYINEVFTDEKYLEKLGFEPDELKALCKRGEIVKTEGQSSFFYRLHHSSLAYAYWQHGNIYRKAAYLHRYDDFIYDYAVSDTANGLEAVIKTQRQVQNKLLRRLSSEGKLESVIEQEKQTWVLSVFIEIADQDIVDKASIMEAIARQIKASSDVESIGSCISNAYKRKLNNSQKLWMFLDKEDLASKLTLMRDSFLPYHCLEEIHAADPNGAKELCDLLDIDKVICNLTQSTLLGIGHYIAVIHTVNQKAGKKVWDFCKQHLADRLNRFENIASGYYCINAIQKACPPMAYELCGLLNLDKIIENFDSRDCMPTYCAIIGKANPEVAKILCKELSTILNQAIDDVSFVAYVLREINSSNPDMAKELCQLMDVNKSVASLNRTEFLRGIGLYINVIHASNSVHGQEIWELLDKRKLATKVTLAERVWEAAECIHNIQLADCNMAEELCGLLDIDRIVVSLDQSEYLPGIGHYIYAIHKAIPDIAQKIWQLLDKRELAAKLNRDKNVSGVKRCIAYIISSDPAMVKELWHFLDPKKFVKNIDQIIKKNSQGMANLWGCEDIFL
jgi:hypothetical protein